MSSRPTLVIVACALLVPCWSIARGADALRSPVTPRLGLFVEQADIARARQRCEAAPWAKAYRERVVKIADGWLARPDEWIRDILPKPGSTFAYGVAGCPKCGGQWANFGQSVASFDRPLVLNCPHCKLEIDLAKPAAPYDDTGGGVIVNGRRFWLRGVWNAFVADQMWSAFNADSSAVVALADAYALTGDDRYAKKLIVIMDALATLAPQTKGPQDFQTQPDGNEGRLQHLTSMTFRAQVHFARALDLVGGHEDLARPSPTNPSRGSAWDNVRHGIFDEYLFVPLDVRGGRLHTLHNHEADSVRAMLLNGLMFGNADHVRWGAEATRAFLDNTIDRDGLYYETSLNYAEFTRSVFIDMAELLVRYDPSKYPASADMPKRSDLPLAGNFFDHAGLARLTLDIPTRMSIVGRPPTFGNNHFDDRVWQKPGRSFARSELPQAARFMLYSTDEARRARAARLAATLYDADPNGLAGWWALYRMPSEALLRDAAGPATGPTTVPTNDRSDFLGQSGIVLLRSGEAGHRRGAMIRVGPTLPHGHDDLLGLLLFAKGRALSGDVGYSIFGNHVHLGWAGRAVAHNTVVINQDETNPDQLFRIGPGGTIERFFDAPGVALTEASIGRVYPESDGVRDARRMILQLDLSPEDAYWVDLFDVDGGRVHDYSMHANPLGDRGSFAVEGVEPKPREGAWTLAALDPKWRGASFDQQGRSWGERLTVNGMIAKLPGVEDEVPDKRDWYPPPGNGYAFLHDVKSAPTTRPWSATWRWDEKGERFGLRMTMLPHAPQQVITATGPNINGADRMRFVIARHGEPGATGDVRSRYAAVLEPFGDTPQLSADVVRQGERVSALRVRADSAEREDLILDARFAPIAPTNLPGLDAGVGVVRRRGTHVVGLILHGGTKLEVDGFAIRAASPRVTARIESTDDDAGTFRVAPILPVAAIGSTIRISNPAYSHGSLYRVADIRASGEVTLSDTQLALGRGRVESATGDGFTSTAPLVYGYEYDRSTRFLDGKRIVIDGEAASIVAQTGFKDLKVIAATPRNGAEFVVYDVQAGDTVELDTAASLVEENGDWVLRSNVAVDVTFPFAVDRPTRVESLELSTGPVRFRRVR